MYMNIYSIFSTGGIANHWIEKLVEFPEGASSWWGSDQICCSERILSIFSPLFYFEAWVTSEDIHPVTPYSISWEIYLPFPAYSEISPHLACMPPK